ncbi:acyltransferase [Aeromonas veronii]|uniref:acyltransferase n=1 Tax=Aeromonas veronii TaxID=654 RepID=UPI003D21CB89
MRSFILYILNFFCDIEFHLCGSKKRWFNYFRRAYLRVNKVVYGKDFSFGCGCYIRSPGNFEFGDRCAIGSFSKFWNYAPIKIGNDFLSAGMLAINTGGHDVNTLVPFNSEVIVGDRVWCGMNVTIIAGVTIGDDVVIAAGSLVNKNVESGAIVAGVPAKVIGHVNCLKRQDAFWSAFK